MTTVLVTGGRDFVERDLTFAIMDFINTGPATGPITLLIHGGARGADSMANTWAIERGVRRDIHRPKYQYDGDKRAPLGRNQEMVDLKPDFVVQFPGGAGTADCVTRARQANIPVLTVTEPRKEGWADE